ncbi:hypothetical protein ACMA1I_22940 [Pontibacter sp. 13R65]|uniref:hypothetical protein n=1 Tax=Pontibacter sp. 13R65 TaxID=3127458 RepID=UPI00301CAB07
MMQYILFAGCLVSFLLIGWIWWKWCFQEKNVSESAKSFTWYSENGKAVTWQVYINKKATAEKEAGEDLEKKAL